MKYNPEKHHRRSIRLKGYDYSAAGSYFITICTHQRECLFGEISNGEMHLNQYGQIIAEEWQRSSVIRQEIELDLWAIMPNHFHGIVIITDNVGANGRLPLLPPPMQSDPSSLPDRTFARSSMQPKSLSSLIAGFKSATTKHINIARNSPSSPVWQRNYYEHIIRDETSCQKIRQYIQTNPIAWEIDRLHPNNPSKW
ncbi:transposase [Pseudanabaena sp. PCC 6802]|uniref:transposase n=1 Tax=Pseudanabaena sp. PCC 6802 TaxID=118173 RepID=UPI000380DBBA|nr:transposase [Pseudanabaena sp. PCC 6802]